MKRLLALLLAALLLALPAFALDYTLEEKLFKQIKDGSGLKLNLRFEKTGGAFSLLQEEGNAFLNTLLAGSQLELRFLRGVGTIKGREDLDLKLTKAEQELLSLRFLRSGQHESLTSSLFDGATYADVRDGSAIMGLFRENAPAWPSAEGMLLRLLTGESSWQSEANKKLEEYSVKLSVFLANHTTTTQQRGQDNQLTTLVTVKVPSLDLKNEITRLLGQMYQDEALKALLAREFTQKQAEAYLQPSLLPGFSEALRLLPETGEVVSERLIDATGQVLQNRITLPMEGARGLSQVVYEQFLENGKERDFLSVFFAPSAQDAKRGAVLVLDAQTEQVPDSPGSVVTTGTLTLYPDPEKAAGAQKRETADGESEQKLDFKLNLTLSPEAVDEASGTASRNIELSLLVTPQGDLADTLSAQTLLVTLAFNSRQRTAAATYVKGKLIWQDLGSQAQLTVDMEGNSAAPWAIPDPLSPQAVMLQNQTPEQLSQLRAQVQSQLQAALVKMMLNLGLPDGTTVPQNTLSPTTAP